jgi:superfamily II DNA or RNA helicase
VLRTELAPGDCVRIRDQRWRIDRLIAYGETMLIDVAGHDAGSRHERTTFVVPAERIERVPSHSSPLVVRPARWRHQVRATLRRSSSTPASLTTLDEADVAVLPFQLEPALAVTSGLADRLLIADEVGLGKTIQASLVVAEVLARTARGRALVVTPAPLRDQWKQELERRFAFKPVVLDRAALSRMGTSDAPEANPWATHPIAIVSSDFIKRVEVIRALESLVWDVLVLDEAHGLAGHSARAHAARSLADRARVVVLLSATPHSGDAAAFQRLCDTGRLERSPMLATFRRTRRDLGLGTSRRSRWLRVRMSETELAMHAGVLRYARLVWSNRETGPAARLAMIVLLKRACSGPAALARSLERRIELLRLSSSADHSLQHHLPFDATDQDDDEPSSILAAPGLRDRHDEQRILKALVALARTATAHDRKLAILQRLLRRIAEPILVFTEYRDTLQYLSAALGHTAQLHGGLTTRERREVLSGFTSGPTRVLLATDAASEGINLHHRCRLVINVELPWTPARLEQRVGRVDRLGQVRRVHAIHLVAHQTGEEDIVQRLLTRSARALTALGDPDTEDEVARAFCGGSEEESSAARPRFRTFDLSEHARREAERASLARAIAAGTNDARRPAITARSGRPAARLCSAVRLAFVDASGQTVWDTVIGMEMGVHRERIGTAARLRELFEHYARAIEPALEATHDEILARCWPMLRRYIATASMRERDIADALARSGARLAAIQPGLFDRRADRLAAAQRATLEEAIARCRQRLAELSRLEHTRKGARDVLFGIALG